MFIHTSGKAKKAIKTNRSDLHIISIKTDLSKHLFIYFSDFRTHT